MKILLAVMAILCASTAFAKDEGVNAVMRHNFQSLMGLQPYLADEALFLSDGSAAEIEKNLGGLSAVGRALPDMVAQSKPSLKAMAEIFADTVVSAESSFKSGHKGYARAQLRTVTAFCMACHTRTEVAQGFKDSENLVAKAKLTPLQKAEYFAATRQFDRALEFYSLVVSNPATDEATLKDINRVVRSYLNVAVRVKQDPKAAQAFLGKVSTIKSVADFYAQELPQWKRDLKTWVQEGKHSSSSSAVDLLNEGKDMVSRAQATQRFPADHRADINYLRATNAVHAALEKELAPKHRADAFYLLGLSYETLNEPFLWDLGPLYYEACVREKPHSATAMQCYKRLSASVLAGFSGSGGVNIPDDQQARLSRLQKLAELQSK